MTVASSFSEYEGPLSTRLRRAAAAHTEAACEAAELALKPGRENYAKTTGRDDVAIFHQHAQAAATLREVAALLDESVTPL